MKKDIVSALIFLGFVGMMIWGVVATDGCIKRVVTAKKEARYYQGEGVFEKAEFLQGNFSASDKTIIYHSNGTIKFYGIHNISCVAGKTYRFYSDGYGRPIIEEVAGEDK